LDDYKNTWITTKNFKFVIVFPTSSKHNHICNNNNKKYLFHKAPLTDISAAVDTVDHSSLKESSPGSHTPLFLGFLHSSLPAYSQSSLLVSPLFS
jgi:hypothetical protein